MAEWTAIAEGIAREVSPQVTALAAHPAVVSRVLRETWDGIRRADAEVARLAERGEFLEARNRINSLRSVGGGFASVLYAVSPENRETIEPAVKAVGYAWKFLEMRIWLHEHRTAILVGSVASVALVVAATAKVLRK